MPRLLWTPELVRDKWTHVGENHARDPLEYFTQGAIHNVHHSCLRYSSPARRKGL